MLIQLHDTPEDYKQFVEDRADALIAEMFDFPLDIQLEKIEVTSGVLSIPDDGRVIKI